MGIWWASDVVVGFDCANQGWVLGSTAGFVDFFLFTQANKVASGIRIIAQRSACSACIPYRMNEINETHITNRDEVKSAALALLRAP